MSDQSSGELLHWVIARATGFGPFNLPTCVLLPGRRDHSHSGAGKVVVTVVSILFGSSKQGRMVPDSLRTESGKALILTSDKCADECADGPRTHAAADPLEL